MYQVHPNFAASSMPLSRRLAASGWLLRGVLILSLLLVQAVGLNHTHGDDYAERVDCDICLKVGSSDDVVVSSNTLTFSITPAALAAPSVTPSYYAVSYPATARAPPLA